MAKKKAQALAPFKESLRPPTPETVLEVDEVFTFVGHCLPESTHQKVGKETGETAHVQRINNTIRQRFSRLVRKTLSFSKREYMLNLHFKLWAYYYNLNVS